MIILSSGDLTIPKGDCQTLVYHCSKLYMLRPNQRSIPTSIHSVYRLISGEDEIDSVRFMEVRMLNLAGISSILAFQWKMSDGAKNFDRIPCDNQRCSEKCKYVHADLTCLLDYTIQASQHSYLHPLPSPANSGPNPQFQTLHPSPPQPQAHPSQSPCIDLRSVDSQSPPVPKPTFSSC